jgi:hypothetical protein
MTILFSENFEGGTNGANVTTSNTAFGQVTPTGSITFSNAHVLTGGGSLAAKAVAATNIPAMTGASSGATPLWTGVTKIYYRFYFYCEVMTSAASTLCNWKHAANGTGKFAESPRLLTTGAIQLRDFSSTQVAVSSTGLVSAGSFYRFEGMIDVTNAQQQIKVFAGSNANGSTADYDSGVVTSGVGTATLCDSLQLGYANSTTATGHFDSLVVNNAAGGFPGPIVTTTGGMKVWNGTSWVIKPVKVWNGTSWVVKPVKFWDGTQWRMTP